MDDPREGSLDAALAGQERGRYVAAMFGRIAARYDLLNRMMSLGQDQRWRRRMAALGALPPGGLALDLATGTGDVALAILERDPGATVIGVDFALPMMYLGRRKIPPGGRIHFTGADALALPFGAERFDALFHAFLMRNIADIPAGFAEQFRVLRPGGRVVCLEITGPASPLVRAGYALFFERLVPRLGALISGDAEAYRYLPASVLRFPSPERLATLMREAGFRQVRYERQMGGAIAIHVGEKH